jgi:hypothetical protein
MSHPQATHADGEATLPEADACKHQDFDCVDELKPGWGVFSCNDCGYEWEASTWEQHQDAADLERKMAREHT